MGKILFFTDAMFPPSLDQVKAYFLEKGMSQAEAEHFFGYYQLMQWRTENGKLMKRWKTAAHGWIASANRATAMNKEKR